MSLPYFTVAIGTAETELRARLDFEPTLYDDERFPETKTMVLGLDDGNVVVELWRGSVHGVIYQTPQPTPEETLAQRDALMSLYSDGHTWNHILDNGFGDTWHRSDGAMICLHSRVMDYKTFRTTEVQAAARKYRESTTSR